MQKPESERRTRKNALFAAAVLALALGACGRKTEQTAEKPQPPAAPAGAPARVEIPPGSPKLAQIRVQPVETAMVALGRVTAPGKVEANSNRISRVFLPVTGRVVSVLVRTGDFVHRGQPLLTVESAEIDAAVSAYQQAQAAVTQAESALAKARLDLDRTRDLYAHGAVPLKEVTNTEAILVQAESAVKQARAAEEQARRRLELLGAAPGMFGQQITIRAPIAGKVLELSVVNGEYRNDLSDALMTIADLSSVWITSDVPETDIRNIRLNAPITFELAAYPGETFHGRVTLIGDTVDPQTRTVKVRSEIPNPDGRLKPEMFGTVHLAEQTEPRPVVPASAVFAYAGRPCVWREAAPGVFERTGVETAPPIGDRIPVLSGLQAGDRVVVDGVMLLAGRDRP
ncbi:MAG: efflux RND transporter periplasmic adaptor subunit [Bryobacteraceae bacterium]